MNKKTKVGRAFTPADYIPLLPVLVEFIRAIVNIFRRQSKP